jgi:3-hydroxyisobutyrate dehydrogenase-like beta-hydroxyacid dehydrogenase
MRIGFIGFGGAGYGLAKGLRQAGVSELFFFDPRGKTPPHDTVILKHGEEVGARQTGSIPELIRSSTIIISCVTGTAALAVAEEAVASLRPEHLFVDVNTASPETMLAVGNVVNGAGVPFVDIAMMGAVPAFLHRVPCLASGDGAAKFKTVMQPFGMEITCVGDIAGQASAIKMFRSIFMKGFLALLLETLTAAHRYHVDDIVLDSLVKTMEKSGFLETVRLQLAKGVISAERMAHEMEAVISTLAEMGMPADMAAATRDKLTWCSRMRLDEHFGGEMPGSIGEILAAIELKRQ